MKKDLSSLKRPKHPMPEFVAEALSKHKLFERYEKRPAYQQNDYIGWISNAKREETRQKRLDQMLKELKEGNRYMNMVYKGD
ncbi:YdeI/OmpD-associated family protein [Chitinophaga sp.]|uniref:YdeI/OmpD-associated family protein n=1 Tax=Chitinophaga sp. TaxID=1869181 RepID=UPI0031DF229F